ncbi:hypothetical protein [Scatolibacter rhodanostii]|uniref:hypothetical protein n=1 Tax=Scatolibacter rhodanostii TaxID=2014781 RepID=UPI00117C398A|nr:hypothetical protein [Scatolibacter rhodanostii]
MTKNEFYEQLDAEQKKTLNTFTKAEEIQAFASNLKLTLDAQVALEIASELPDELLEDVSGGFSTRGLIGNNSYE